VARPDLAGAYADARGRLGELLGGLDEAWLSTPVPACPAWTVHDVLAHLTGVAADAAGGRYFAGAADSWRDAGLARATDEWTAAQVTARRHRPVAALVAEWARSAATLEPMLAGTAPLPAGSPPWLPWAPVADLSVHLHDVRGALGRPGDRDAPVTALGLRFYARWLGRRLDEGRRPALRLRAGTREWVEGAGEVAAALTAEPFALFRTLSGRRSPGQVHALDWAGDPGPYLEVLSPYPMPASPLVE
jgi:uncharacterized protein (TIGR03083 family)